MHILLFLAAVWVLPALVIAALYAYETACRRALRPAPAQEAVEARAHLAAQRPSRRRRATLEAQPLAAPVHSPAGPAREVRPVVRIEVPLLLHDTAGHVSVERCTLCLN